MATFLLISAVNKYDSNFYGSGNDLHGCIKDAEKMKVILSSLDREITLQELYDENCTKLEVLSAVKWAAENMKSGDRFIWFHSGHGSYLDTPKGRSTCRCLHDAPLWDSEIVKSWKLFPAGAKVVTLSDTCYSEDNSKKMPGFDGEQLKARTIELPKSVKIVPLKGNVPTKIGLFNLSACTLVQVSYENKNGGIFTQAINEVYLTKGVHMSWTQFSSEIQRATPEQYHQNPVYECNASKVGKALAVETIAN